MTSVTQSACCIGTGCRQRCHHDEKRTPTRDIHTYKATSLCVRTLAHKWGGDVASKSSDRRRLHNALKPWEGSGRRRQTRHRRGGWVGRLVIWNASVHWCKRHAKRLLSMCTSHQLPYWNYAEFSISISPLLMPSYPAVRHVSRYYDLHNCVLTYINDSRVLDRLKATRRNAATTERCSCRCAQHCNMASCSASAQQTHACVSSHL